MTHNKGFAFKSNLYKDNGCPLKRVTNFTANSRKQKSNPNLNPNWRYIITQVDEW